ncbi:MAG TPA: DUF4389 domain-containing protein [Acidimicrobiales bacterium]
MAYAPMAVPDLEAEMWFDGPSRQRRWTVLLRIILAIPQVIVVFFLTLVLLVVAIIGWLGALVMGRLPDWAHSMISGIVRIQTRLNAYYFLLTDEYPPFDTADEPYPVRPVTPSGGRLNRWAVLFRVILVIPASFFQAVVSYGLTVPMLFVTWVIVLFGGQMPTALYWAYAALLRYEFRVSSYFFLLTSEYPRGMFGDASYGTYPPPPIAPQWPPAAPAASDSTTSFPPPPPVTTSSSPTEVDPTEPVPNEPLAAPGWPPSAAPPLAMPPPSPWDRVPPPPPPPPSGPSDRSRLVLPSAARGWLIFAIVWGAILYVGSSAVRYAFTNNLDTRSSQYNTVVNDYNASLSAIDQATQCSTLSCLRTSEPAVATALNQYTGNLVGMNLPAGTTSSVAAVESDLSQLSTAFTSVANSPNQQVYQSRLQSSQVNTFLQTLHVDTNNLLTAINSSVF